MANFRRDALTKALEQRLVIQATLLRSTIHMVSPRDYGLFQAATREGRREWFRRITRKQFGDLDMEGAASVVREHLRGGPCRATELKALLAARGFPPVIWAGIGLWVDMVRIPPSGTWDQRRADLYGLSENWIAMPTPSEAPGLAHVVRRYLGGFGPASVPEIADWAGIPQTKLSPIIDKMLSQSRPAGGRQSFASPSGGGQGGDLRTFRDEKGKELIDLPRAPIPDAATPAPVRFLPTWDATLLVHARRTQILPERYRPLVFNTKTPHSVPTFLVDGAVAGTWRYEGGPHQARAVRASAASSQT